MFAPKLNPLNLATAMLVTALTLCSQMRAQTSTAEILGTVSDTSGASVPNATVTLLNVDTNDKRT